MKEFWNGQAIVDLSREFLSSNGAERHASAHILPGRTWQPRTQSQPQGEMSFEDMMSQFKSRSEEKISDLRRVTEARRGGGYSRRGD